MHNNSLCNRASGAGAILLVNREEWPGALSAGAAVLCQERMGGRNRPVGARTTDGLAMASQIVALGVGVSKSIDDPAAGA